MPGRPFGCLRRGATSAVEPIDPVFEEALQSRLRTALDGVDGPNAKWASAPARSRVEGRDRPRRTAMPALAALAALVAVFIGLRAAGLPWGPVPTPQVWPSASGGAPSQGPPSYTPTRRPTSAPTRVSPTPAASPTKGSGSPSSTASPSPTPSPTPAPTPTPPS